MTTLKQQSGQQAELLAQRYLQRVGLNFLSANFRCRFGEIDLIMRDEKTIVFVEVRYRKTSLYGTPDETVTWHKQQKLIRTADYFLQKYQLSNSPCRFDVIGLSQAKNQPDIVWIKDAFQVQYD